jgi:hypothetical protein
MMLVSSQIVRVSNNIINKINVQLTQPPHDQATREMEFRRTPNKNRTGRKAEHGQDNHLNDT